MKERPIIFSSPMVRAILENRKTQTRRDAKYQEYPGIDWKYASKHAGSADYLCPYGIPGDRLWVRESWRFSSSHDDLSIKDVPHDDHIEYVADKEKVLTGKIRPSIFMPRRLSRITLEITKIRVERLHDISEEDAIAEGVRTIDMAASDGATWCDRPIRAYRFLWNSIHGKDSWDLNTWVWVIEFRRVS